MLRFLNIKFMSVFFSTSLGLIMLLACLASFSPAWAATTLTVNLATDVGDVSPGDGNCDSDGGTSGNQCTLRAAIEEANALTGKDTIRFSIGQPSGVPRTIYIQSELPAIAGDVEIDGDNLTGGGAVTLNGDSAGTGAEGLIFQGGDSWMYDLIVKNFDGAGVLITGTASITMTANTVFGAGESGIEIHSSHNNIGTTSVADRNYIYSNTHYGILARGDTSKIQAIFIHNNYIGLDRNGNANVPNDNGGIFFDNVKESVVGGNTSAGNVIAGNDLSATGIEFFECERNYITGNLIGTDASGSQDSGFNDGILLSASDQIIVGGYGADYRNLISGNDDYGIRIEIGSGSTIPDGNYIWGNYIGTNISGTAAIPNGSGIYITDGNGTHIGDSTAGAGNIIAGNLNYGIRLASANTTQTSILGNSIGVDANGDPLYGYYHGIFVYQAGETVIGGLNTGEANIIANHGNYVIKQAGVCIDGSTGIEVRGNSIYNNGPVTSTVGLGIDLAEASGCDGVTANDLGDVDTGSNDLINFPVLTGVISDSNYITVTGIISSEATKGFWVDLYGNDACDASGHGEGQTYLGTTSSITDDEGNGSFSIQMPYAKYYSALAVDVNGNTSEFSACIEGPRKRVFLPVLLR
ncbi:MAG: right-handed parallel beta-helix repeat-containing protein [Anaerolineales bacterium]|nr:right-handed parallel beta-helix repeat-containing protein [Anaerolineales bacterium]